MALSAAYAVCTTIICLEVVVVLGLLAYLFKKPSDSGTQLKPDPTNVISKFQNEELENEPVEAPKYTIEYGGDVDDLDNGIIEEEPEEDRPISDAEPSNYKSITEGIKLPSEQRPVRPNQTSSDSSSSDSISAKVPEQKFDADIEPVHVPSGSSSPSSRRSEPPEVEVYLPLTIPPLPEDVVESEIVAGADDVELENGWRRHVKLSALQRTRLIDRRTVDKYLVGDISKEELVSSLKTYLDGEEPIAGIVMMDTGEKKSIYKAAKEGYIRRGTAISILEAQAATGNIIDPLTGRKMSVTEAAQLGLLDKIYEQCLLRAERAVSGYKTRLSDEKLSIFEAMTRGLVVEEHAIRLLESQIATGGIIDVRNNHRVPVEYALKRGLIDERIYRILKESSSATKGFEDPNTDEKVNYEELMGRCILDMDTGLRLLPFEKPSFEKIRSQSSSPISSNSSFERFPSIASVPSKPPSRPPSKPASGVEEDEEEGKVSTPKLSSVEIDIEVKPDSESDEGVSELKIVDETVSTTSKSSTKSPKVVHQEPEVLPEPEVIEEANVSKQKSKKIPEEPAIESEIESESVLEDAPDSTTESEAKPEKAEKISEKIDKFKQKIEEVQRREREEEERENKEKEKQKREEDKQTKHVKKEARKRIETDTATEQSDIMLSSDDTEQDNLVELSSLTTSDAHTDIDVETTKDLGEIAIMGEVLRKPTIGDSSSDDADLQTVREATRKSKRKSKKKDKKESSSVPSTPKTPKSIKSKKISTPKLPKAPTPIAPIPIAPESEDEITGDPTGPTRERENITFTTGWRMQCRVEDLLEAGLISESKVKSIESGHLQEGDAEVQLSQWLHGSSPIAGLLIIQTGEKMSLYSAAKRGFLRRGTAISLLEAQAATGNVIDPITGEYMAVEEATRKGLIDRQYEAILARAEKAVYGYKSKFTEDYLSIYQALQKGMLIENHAIRLLEAQIVTGGIVDPHKHHRCPIQLAIRRGLYDDKLKSVLDGNNEDVKGFFDPNTEENLNYSELVERCVTDAETGLLLLPFKKKPPEEKLSGPLAKAELQNAL